MKKAFSTLLIGLVSIACREELTPLRAPVDSPLVSSCKPPSIEKNILGTWHFVTSDSPDRPVRTGTVTFDAQKHIIDPDSLFESHLDIGSKIVKVIDKIYDTNGTYPATFEHYKGKIFRVDLLIKPNVWGRIWPFYVAINECDKIVIYQLASYTSPVKVGFTLTR